MIQEANCYTEPRVVSKELRDFARRQFVNSRLYRGEERRADERHIMVVPVWAVPVNEQHDATDDPFQVITRDVSARGIGLFHQSPINEDRLAIQMRLAQTEVNLVIDVTWMRPMGPFYGSAGIYISKLEQFPARIPDVTSIEG